MNDKEWETRAAAEEAWENSPQGVRYRLGAGTNMLAVSCGSMDILVTVTVAALPEEVREFVYDNCQFATVGAGTSGQVLSPAFDRWIIMLDAAMTKEFNEAECQGIIAHEIAHAFLGHDQADPVTTIECEREAAAQAAAWGFSGIGTDPEHYFNRS